jgi:hypothetical protein
VAANSYASVQHHGESGPDYKSLPVNRYRRIWRSTRQLTSGWELLKKRYPSDFVEFIDGRVVN